MLKKNEYPILEFDDDTQAIITPEHFGEAHGLYDCNKLVISFFKDAINKFLEEKR